MFRSVKRLALVSLALPFALVIAGCATAGTADEEEVNSAQEAATEAPRGPMGHGHEGRFGRPNGGELLMAALHELDDLSAEQRKTIEGSLEKLGRPDHAGMKEIGKTLAEGVRKGKIDEAAVKAKADALEQQGESRRAEVVKALQTLHDTLTPAQRATLVANLEERAEKHPMHGPRGAKDGHHGPMGILMHDLDLTDAQKEQIKAGFEASMQDKPSREEMGAKRKATLEAFRQDKFDASAALPEKAPHRPFEHMVKALSVIVPVLDAAQRDKLAYRLEKGPEHPRFEKHGRMGKPGVDEAAPSR